MFHAWCGWCQVSPTKRGILSCRPVHLSPALQRRFVFCSTPLPRLRTVGSGEDLWRWWGWLKGWVEGFRTGPCPGNLSLFMSKSQASCIRLLENVSHVIWWDIERHYIHPGIRKHGKMISIQKQIYRFIHKISRGSRQQQVYPNPMSSLMWAAQTLHSLSLTVWFLLFHLIINSYSQRWNPQSWGLSHDHNHNSSLVGYTIPVLVVTSCRSIPVNTLGSDRFWPVTGAVLDIWRCCAEDFPSFLACPPSSTVGMLPAGSRRLQVFRSHRHENMALFENGKKRIHKYIYVCI